MSTHDDEILARLLEAVIDGKPVDWDAETFTDPAVKRRAERLRVLEAIAHAHGGVDTTSPPTETALPFASWGRLQLVERLDAGSTGEVFRARDPLLEREVALKLQRPTPGDTDADTRFLEEARRMARVRHPGVLFIHGADRHQGRAGLWTDLLHGRTLEEQLRRQGPLGPVEAALAGTDLCRALAAIHGAGLVHRDVKTTNVMREEGGRIVLMDFSTSAEGGTGAPEGRTRGSPLYMAPELLRGRPATPSSDLYALGVVLFRLATGRFPHEAETLEGLAEKLDRGDRLRLLDLRPELPESFVRTVERALDPDPARRYATAGEMEAALARTAASANGGGSRTRASRRPLPRLLVAAAAVALIAGGVTVTRHLSGRALPPLSLEATLFKRGADGDLPVVSGSSIQPGDRLFLEVSGKEPLHLYVFDEDETGHAFLLFPLPDLDLQNPLPGGSRHRLPGTAAGIPRSWEVDTAGGEERILLVAARSPLPDLVQATRAFALPEAGSEADGRRFRGVGRLASEPRSRVASGTDPSRLDALLARLMARPGGDVWTHQVDLRNPSP